MTDVVIRADGLVKYYGSTQALAGVDLDVERGEVFGFLGPNGAGKTTTIRILLNILRPTRGSIEVLGTIPQRGRAELRSRIGYLPGELCVSGGLTGGELLHHYAALRGGAGRDKIEPLASRFGLDLCLPIKELSKGNKQKVGVVQAFMHDPELLILDEPTSGLDPLLQREFLDLVLEHQSNGATVFMSSHVLSEVEDVAERVAIIRDGVIVGLDEVHNLRHRAGQRVELGFAEPVSAAEFAQIAGVDELSVENSSMSCLLRGEPDALLKAASKHRVVSWAAEDLDLEDLFLDYYRTNEAPASERSLS